MAVFDAGSPAYQGTTVTSSATQVFSVTNLTSPWGVTVLNQGPSNVWVGAGTVTTSSGVLLISGAQLTVEGPAQNLWAITASSTVQGNKAFAYISSVQANSGAVTTGGVSIGTGNKFGLPFRADLPEYQQAFFAGAAVTFTVGTNLFLADQTPVATSATGDVRGTIVVTAAAGSRLQLFQQAPIAQAKVSNNIDFRGLLGVTQA